VLFRSASRYLARIMETHLQPGLGQPERCGATCHTAADHDGVGGAVELPLGNRRCRLGEPVAGQLRIEVALAIGTKARLPTSLVPFTVLYA